MFWEKLSIQQLVALKSHSKSNLALTPSEELMQIAFNVDMHPLKNHHHQNKKFKNYNRKEKIVYACSNTCSFKVVYIKQIRT